MLKSIEMLSVNLQLTEEEILRKRNYSPSLNLNERASSGNSP